MSALPSTLDFSTRTDASTVIRRVIDATELPAFCPLPAAAADDRLSFLFRATLKLGRIHPLYLPMLRYRHGKAGRG